MPPGSGTPLLLLLLRVRAASCARGLASPCGRAPATNTISSSGVSGLLRAPPPPPPPAAALGGAQPFSTTTTTAATASAGPLRSGAAASWGPVHRGAALSPPAAAARGRARHMATAPSPLVARAAAEPAAMPQQPQQQQHQPQQQPTTTPPTPPPPTTTTTTNNNNNEKQQQQYNPPPQPPGVRRTFYRRVLPSPPATAFSSPEGRALFAEALAQGTMAGFFPLIEQYSTQDEPAFCGLSSLTMVLNALAIDPRRPWKGAWRWFHERLLDCCLPLSAVAAQGVTLDQAACLARCNGAVVELRRSGAFSLGEFRAAVADACATGERHLVVSYARAAFGQTGDGHFSPIGGYHAGRDLALILDTARFKYPPHWVPVPMLFEAMEAVDKATGLPRGWLRLSAPAHPQDSVLFTLDVREHGRWRAAERFVLEGAGRAAREAAAARAAGAAGAGAAGACSSPTAEDVVRAVVAAAAAQPCRGSVGDFVAVRLAARERAVDRGGNENGGGGGGGGGSAAGTAAGGHGNCAVATEPCVPLGKRDQLLAELRHMPLFALVSDALENSPAAAAAAAAAGPAHAHAHPHPHPHSHDEPLREAAQVAAAPGGEDGLLAEKLTVLLFLVDPKQWPGAAEWGKGGDGVGGGGGGGVQGDEEAAAAAAARFAALLDASSVSLVEAEVRYMREQLRFLPAVLGSHHHDGAPEGARACGTGGAGAAAGAGAGAGAAAAAAADGAAPAPPPPPPSSDGSDCGKCFTPLDCHVKGHSRQG